ncbi:hypothetical protein Pelo_5885 [Pelomyxa schiedti]|nr:hypothetical protein Pelo_5885 [Pelomyxa schiedti]
MTSNTDKDDKEDNEPMDMGRNDATDEPDADEIEEDEDEDDEEEEESDAEDGEDDEDDTDSHNPTWKKEEEEIKESVLLSYKPVEKPCSKLTLKAQDQFLAFCMATHTRCGMRSPLRILSTNISLLRHLWGIWVKGRGTLSQLAAERFAIVVSPGSSVGACMPWFPRLFFSFGISQALGGITEDLKEHMWLPFGRVRKARDFFDDDSNRDGTENKYYQPDPYGSYREKHRRKLLTHAKARDDSNQHMRTNYKWWLWDAGEGQSAVVVIENLFDINPEKTRRVVTLPSEGHIIDIGFNHVNIDEAYVVVINDGHSHNGISESSATVTFVVIDLAKTHQTGELVVLSETRCSLPGKYEESVIFQRNGGRIFIVEVRLKADSYDTPHAIFSVEGTTGTLKHLTQGTQLREMTDSVFQVAPGDGVAIDMFTDPSTFTKVHADLWDVGEGVRRLKYIELRGW